MDNHNKIVSALTEWDSKQSKNKRGYHNKYFLGIALEALGRVELEFPGAPIEKIVSEAFEGHLYNFIMKFITKKIKDN